MKSVRIILILSAGFSCLNATASFGQLKINEVYYNVSPQGGNQFVELYNAGSTNDFLDGKIVTDEAGSGIEGVYKFPGNPGETNYPVVPGQFVMIAVDATGATINANWEFYAGGADSDNPSVPNLTLASGTNDFSLAAGGDNVILADGTDTTAPIAISTIIDGMNYGGGDGELAALSSSVTNDVDPNPVASTGSSLSRCSDGQDSDASSSADFTARTISPGLPNCGIGIFIADATVLEGSAGTTNIASFVVTLTATNNIPITVNYFTSDGTATAGSDYNAAANTLLTFAPGTTSQTINVSVLGDNVIESNETFFVFLQTATNAAIVDSQATGTIIEDDPQRFTWIGQSAGTVTATWTTVAGFVYLPQYSTSATSAAWTDLGGAITASSSSATLTDSAASGRVYRILQLQY